MPDIDSTNTDSSQRYETKSQLRRDNIQPMANLQKKYHEQHVPSTKAPTVLL